MKIYRFYIYIIVIYITDHINVTANDLRDTWNLTGRVINDTWIVEHFYINPSLRMFKIHVDNLFDGNKEFSKYNQINFDITFLLYIHVVHTYFPCIKLPKNK